VNKALHIKEWLYKGVTCDTCHIQKYPHLSIYINALRNRTNNPSTTSGGEALVKLQRGKQIPKKEGSGDRGRPHKVERKGEKGENNVHPYSPEKPTQWRCWDLTREVDDFKEKGKSFSRKRNYLLNRVNYFISTLVYMFLFFPPYVFKTAKCDTLPMGKCKIDTSLVSVNLN
jgi:hypothetical protein